MCIRDSHNTYRQPGHCNQDSDRNISGSHISHGLINFLHKLRLSQISLLCPVLLVISVDCRLDGIVNNNFAIILLVIQILRHFLHIYNGRCGEAVQILSLIHIYGRG